MTSTTESQPQSRPVRSLAIVTHGRVDVHVAVDTVRAVATRAGVAVVDEPAEAELVVVLGGDGTILRTLARLLGEQVPVIGVNFGRVGFFASIRREELESGLARVFGGDYRVVPLTTIDAEAKGERASVINDVVTSSSVRGRMVELDWAIGGEDLGVQPCDGMIAATPSGSTAYNLSNGGPVLVRGLDAMALSFIAPHSLHVRPLVVPRGLELEIRNETLDVGASVIVDGHAFTDLGHGEAVLVRLGDRSALLATLPETTFFSRYRETFGS
jgi:NAD+ kinase